MLLRHSIHILTFLILIAGCDQQPVPVVEEPVTTKQSGHQEQKDRQSSIDDLKRCQYPPLSVKAGSGTNFKSRRND